MSDDTTENLKQEHITLLYCFFLLDHQSNLIFHISNFKHGTLQLFILQVLETLVPLRTFQMEGTRQKYWKPAKSNLLL
jgi:hypothetical protein